MRKKYIISLITICLQLFIFPIHAADTTFVRQYKTVAPEKLGLSTVKLSIVDKIAKEGITAKAYPGCQIAIAKNGQLVYNKAFGYLTSNYSQMANSQTLYDLASLTKTTATLFAVMKLYDQGKIKLNDKASQYLRFLHFSDKSCITIEDLLFHRSGLPSYFNFQSLILTKTDSIEQNFDLSKPKYDSEKYKFIPEYVSKQYSDEFPFQAGDSLFLHRSTHELAMEWIAQTPLQSPIYRYSCINFILLKEIIEKISGQTIDEFLQQEFYTPLGLQSLGYLPAKNHDKKNIAPTAIHDSFRNGTLKGYVHDPAAAFLGNISGNAGLFGNAADIATLYQVLLNHGTWDGKDYLSKATCKLFLETTSEDGQHGLGFDKPKPSKPANNPCGKSAPMAVVGHTGYTGTCVWLDPKNNMVFVFLSNRTYPQDGVNKLAKLKIRPRIHEQIYQSFTQNIKY